MPTPGDLEAARKLMVKEAIHAAPEISTLRADVAFWWKCDTLRSFGDGTRGYRSYVPTSSAVVSTCPAIACSKSTFPAPEGSLSCWSRA